MEIQLINEVDSNLSVVGTVLKNRGIPVSEIKHYLNTTDEDIESYYDFGKDVIKEAAKILVKHIQNGSRTLMLIDCDSDGYTSSALFTNYLHDIAPTWTENYLVHVFHEGKQHGLGDIEIPPEIKLVLVPDAGSNDYEICKELKSRNVDVVILDHHEAEYVSPDAIVINNQLSNYKNKELSGVGVVYQFCRYLHDLIPGSPNPDKYLDLVATGLR